MTPSSSVAPSHLNASLSPLSVVAGREAIDPPILVEHEPLPKRILDLAFCGVLLVATAPAWPLIAVAVKLEDGGPVFYRQRRWGQGGRLFDVFKFRTMISDSGVPSTASRRSTRVKVTMRRCSPIFAHSLYASTGSPRSTARLLSVRSLTLIARATVANAMRAVARAFCRSSAPA